MIEVGLPYLGAGDDLFSDNEISLAIRLYMFSDTPMRASYKAVIRKWTSA